ncbi:MAG: beta-ketoacyl-[acyl-carrier-protein] synthase family protein [Myxococcota bacterium]|nr:beta-ketoacyl-[acyl-carrier-protein] synthase family protein [Myxococcota bacterium]
MGPGIKRAVVTGLGVVSPLGNDRRSFTDGVLAGRSGITEIDAYDPSPFRSPFAGVVRGFDPLDRLTKEEIDTFPDPYLHFAIAAARDALQDAGLMWARDNPPGPRAGLVVGTCNGGLKAAEEQYEIILGMKPGRFDKRMNLLIRYHAAGMALAHCLGISGPTWVVTTACSSSTGALAVALELISHGVVDTVLTGGADALCLATLAGFNQLKAASTGKTAPFSQPPGLNLGEGAGFWVVEELTAAQARGATIEGELLGYAFTADAHHPTAPDPRGDGAYRTMQGALQRAGLSVDQIGCINAHGTGTEANDRAETRGIAKLTDDSPMPVYSFKSQVGHCLGAAGILEATAGLVAMQCSAIPATINFTEPRPGCHLDYVPNTPRKADYKAFLSCNYAFGGHNAGIAIGAYDPARQPIAGPDPTTRTALLGGSAVTAFGIGMAPLLDGLYGQQRHFSRIADRVGEGPPLQATRAGLVPDFSGRDVDRRLDLKGMNPISRFATAAARLALKEAGVRIGPKEGLVTGIVNGVYAGPDEETQMLAVIPSKGALADIGDFSQVVANATAGWVSNALLLKGYTTTISQGADAGLFALLMAHFAIQGKSSTRLLAGASDELFARYLRNYDELGLLHLGNAELNYGMNNQVMEKRVLGEGAAYLVAEEAGSAVARGARVLAHLVGYGMTMDAAGFYAPNTDPAGLVTAIEAAVNMAGWQLDDVGLVTWSPQGNKIDIKVLEALRRALGQRGLEVPMVTSVFNTGLCEASSGVITLAAILGAWSQNRPLWPQMTGVPAFDERVLPIDPVPLIAIASSELGYNLALAIAPAIGDIK